MHAIGPAAGGLPSRSVLPALSRDNHSMVLLPEDLQALQQAAKEVGVDLCGAVLNLGSENDACTFSVGTSLFLTDTELEDGKG